MADDKFLYSGKVRFPSSVAPLMTPLDSVRQFEGNPNNADLEAIIDSIRVNGFTSIITADATTKQIVAGNHRWQALHALGATHAPVLFVDYQSPEEAKRYLVADNRTGQLARPDESMLLDILKELKESDLRLAGTGFDDQSFAELLISTQPEDYSEIGGAAGHALFGIYEVTVSFESADERDEFYADMCDRFDSDDVRTMDL